jgi:hypothetical protein
MLTIRVFHYLESLDAFVVTEEYRALAEKLGDRMASRRLD